MTTAIRDADLLPFLRAIAAVPTDPLPKLILADYLDEHGDDAAVVMRWAGNVNKYPRRITLVRFEWNAGVYALLVEDEPGQWVSRALLLRMAGRMINWRNPHREEEAFREGYAASKEFETTTAAFSALVAAARQCAADGVDPFGEY